MSAKKATQKSAKSTTASGKTSKGFTDEERAAACPCSGHCAPVGIYLGVEEARHEASAARRSQIRTVVPTPSVLSSAAATTA